MTKTNGLLFGAFVVMALLQAMTAGQRDRAKDDVRVLVGLYNGVLIGRDCEPRHWPDEDPLIEDTPGRSIPQALRL